MLYFSDDDEISAAVAGELIKLRKVDTLNEGYKSFSWWRGENQVKALEDLRNELAKALANESVDLRVKADNAVKEVIKRIREGVNDER